MPFTCIYNYIRTIRFKFIALLLLAVPFAHAAKAEGATGVPKESSMNDPMVVIMIVVMMILLLIIGLLAHVLLGAAGLYYEKQTEPTAPSSSKTGSAITATVLLLLVASPCFAQEQAVVAPAVSSFGGLSPTAFYMITGVITLELLVVFVLLFQLKIFLARRKLAVAGSASAIAIPKPVQPSWWDKLNKFRPAEQEAQIDLGHEYDGIRELDNRLPPWWLYGFYITIIFACIYLWQHHVSHSAPSSEEELVIDMREAAEQQQAYLKKAANSVDENTVKLISDAALLENGQKIFIQNCAACHGKEGEGMVGPNLTDDYWLHGGSIQDIFKTIKYGWPDKGMKSWKDDLSPAQIAQVASFIKHLHGTNPPNPKEKQGELYVETATPSGKDSVTTSAAENK